VCIYVHIYTADEARGVVGHAQAKVGRICGNKESQNPEAATE
jgi:hypothetical protein